ncbi:DEAD/DEAH box helicase [bacterium]|nr:DEAD/DEAH box helicase [bacterium]
MLKPVYRKMTNEELSNQTNIFLDQLKAGKTLEDILPNAFAVAREAIYRVHGLFAFHVQIIGAIIANNGDFVEMYTGEGKTLTVVIVAYLNALSKKGVHIVTVNEYLVKRDAQFCAQCLNPLGITVGYNLTSMDQNEKRKMFSFDITYTTNAELGFDYLRDNMVTDYNQKVLRELHYAIIDEADSILIDESRTPLIISGQPKHDQFFYLSIDKCVKTLSKEDYMIDRESQTISLTESGVDKVQKNLKIKKLYIFENSELIHKIKNSLIANYLFEYGVQYIVKDNKIKLIDHFTGRILEGRSYNAGLQQAIQAKENLPIDPENNIVATITYQSFFRLYHKLSGFSGTALTAAEELLNNYNMVVVPIPTNKKIIRKDLNDYIFETKAAK